MSILEISKADITSLNDSDLRELVGRLCEAELKNQSMPISGVFWGGSQTSADDGLDAEVILEVAQPNPDFVPRQHTGFQVKKNSMAAQACFNEMHLRGNIRPIFEKLADEGGAYIIVSGKDDCTRKMLDDRTDKMESAISHLQKHKNLKLDFYGVDRLATWVRKHPSIVLWIRGKLGKPLSGWKGFERWAATPNNLTDEYLVDDKLLVLDSSLTSDDNKSSVLDSINKIRKLLLSPKTAVRITGLSGVGKTRFAQALFEDNVGEVSLNPSQVIYADLGEHLIPSATDMLAQLIVQREHMILVLDNCPPDVHRSLQKKLKETDSQISLLTIEYDISDDKPEETKVFHLESASEEIVEKILVARFPSLNAVNSIIIANFSGGNSRLAIALAERVDAGESLSGFSDNELFQRLFTQRKEKDNSLLESAETLSLVYSYSIDTASDNPELDALAEISAKTVNELYRASETLFKRQLVQKRGQWRALLPHALANRIAKQALSNIPDNQVLLVILRSENKRLLKSFSKRLSYLHDSEEANVIAINWLSESGILGDLNGLSSDEIEIFKNIASVNPKVTLDTLKKNAEIEGFATRQNNNFSSFVSLLRKLAYEERFFREAVDIIVKFARTEKDNENYNSISKPLSHLFHFVLSGTKASPEVRAEFINNLFVNGDDKDKKIAINLLSAALQSNSFISFHDFDFGARPRDYGYYPTTREEQQKWYDLFLSTSLEIFMAGDGKSKQMIMVSLGRHFRGLWSIGMYDELENIVQEITKIDFWFEGWKGVRDTLNFDKNYPSEIITRLEKLEKILRPDDTRAKIDSLIFHGIHDNIQFDIDTYEDNQKAIENEIKNFGEIVANDNQLFDEVAKRLTSETSDSQYYFAQGLAIGSVDKKRMFTELLNRITAIKENQHLNISVLGGFIYQIHAENSELADELLGLALENKTVRERFVSLQCYIPINKVGSERILELAKDQSVPIWQFQSLSCGRCHEALTDDELAVLINQINQHEKGSQVSLNILQMRFFGNHGATYSDNLIQAGRETLKTIFTKYRETQHNDLIDYEISQVCKVCLTNDDATKKVLKCLISAILNHHIYSFNITETLKTICKEHTTTVLDVVYENADDKDYALYLIFKDNMHQGSPFDLVESDEIIKWCNNGDDERFIFAAKTIFPFHIIQDKDTLETLEKPSTKKEIVIDKKALAILENSPDKEEIVTVFYQRCAPSTWRDSRSTVMRSRRKALKQLLNHSDETIASISKKLNEEIKNKEELERQNDIERDSQREQRFE